MADKFLNLNILTYFWNRLKTKLDGKVNTTDYATDSTYGIVKTNSNESVTLNANGQLDVGGRLGQMSNTSGIFHAKDREPRSVGDYSFLITDTKGMEFAGSRNMGLLTGNNLTLKSSHAAGSTEYQVANNYNNRLICKAIKYLSLNNTTATQTLIEPVLSVTINGQDFTPDSSASSNTPIIIKVANSVNPDSAVTQLRSISAVGSSPYSSLYLGQCTGADGGGGCLVMGQQAFNSTGNMCVLVGQNIFNAGHSNTLVGRSHISKQNRWFMAGTGHDNTNGRTEAGAVVGQWSYLDSNTLFAVGNGTAFNARKNAFEVLADGIVLLSPNGSRYKISVDNSGNLTTTAL